MTVLAVTLRRMQAQDLDQVVRLERQLFPDPWSRRAFASELENPLSLPWVAVIPEPDIGRERVVGYLVLWLQGESGEIANFAVASEYQGRGVGTALFRQALHAAQALGLKKLGLEVRVTNHDAIQWYLRRGFRIVRRLPGYYRVGPRQWEDGWRMELTLTSPSTQEHEDDAAHYGTAGRADT